MERSMKEIRLRSVNWEHGMLLTPDHFLRQERYLESLFGWALRFIMPGAGLVGGGVRLPDSDLGTLRNDPEVSLNETADWLDVSVARARGITPSGHIVDVAEAGALSTRFTKDHLAGVAEAIVYVVCNPGERETVDGVADPFNPQMRTERIMSYHVALDVTAVEHHHSIAVGRLRRPATGMYFEADANYIPPCAVLSAHSELMAGTRRILETVNRLASGYAELHRAMREFMVLFTERGIDTDVDRDSINFAERMVLELQNTAYDLLDRNQNPTQFFGRVRRMLHSAAIYFDLATGMQQYYDTLRETGETELLALIETQKHALQIGRTLRLEDDLGLEVRKALQSLSGLERLERALEGKYIDFRKSSSLESTNFIFDRGGKVLYKLASKPARVQGIADEMTIFFSNLRLEGRDRYRLILVGDRNAPFLRGTSIGAEIRINEGSGFRRDSIILTSDVKLDEQYNLELDFEAPDVPTITDLRVTVPAYHTVHTALLFIRHRFYIGRTNSPELRTLDPRSNDSGRGNEAVRNGDQSLDLATKSISGSNGERNSERFADSRSPVTYAASVPSASTVNESLSTQQPPWMPRDAVSSTQNTSADDTGNRPRRRRLE
jgi:hypothetical protein